MPDPENIDDTPPVTAAVKPLPDKGNEEEPVPVPDWSVWQYNGPPGRMYLHIPVTVNPGDRLRWHSLPADDGAWSPTGEDPTIHPDNFRPEPAPAAGADLKEPGTDA